MKIDSCGSGLNVGLIIRALIPEKFDIFLPVNTELPGFVREKFSGFDVFKHPNVPTGEIWFAQGQNIIGKVINLAPVDSKIY